MYSLLSVVCYIAESTGLIGALFRATIGVDDWYSLGLALGLDVYEVFWIHNDNIESASDCQKAMISQWLNTDNASWRALVRALAYPPVTRSDLAIEIALQHFICEMKSMSVGYSILYFFPFVQKH